MNDTPDRPEPPEEILAPDGLEECHISWGCSGLRVTGERDSTIDMFFEETGVDECTCDDEEEE